MQKENPALAGFYFDKHDLKASNQDGAFYFCLLCCGQPDKIDMQLTNQLLAATALEEARKRAFTKL